MSIQRMVKKHRGLIVFIPIFILYIFLVDLVLGVGVKDNSVWEKGLKWSRGK